MPKRLLQAVTLTILIQVLALTSSPNFSTTTSAQITQASKTSITLLYRWLDSWSERLTKQFDNRFD